MSESRTREQLRRHYEVEKELANRLRAAPDRAARLGMLGSLYDEMFERVPDHPRLLRSEGRETRLASVEKRMRLLRPVLDEKKTLLELGAGDCLMALEACALCERVIAADISDQRDEEGKAEVPENFELVMYDGFDLPLADESVDLAFSYQMLEHLHPDDMEAHFRETARVLRPGGGYLFSTPHRLTGPHDVSRHFAEEPEGFHLKEWAHWEFFGLVRQWGFRQGWTVRRNEPVRNKGVNAATCAAEGLLEKLPRNWQRRLGDRVFSNVVMLVEK